MRFIALPDGKEESPGSTEHQTRENEVGVT